MIRSMFSYFEDEQDREPGFIRMARNLVVLVIAVNAALLPLVSGLVGEQSRNPPAFLTLLLALAVEIVALVQILRGRVFLAKVVVPLALILAVTVISLTTNGLKNSGMVGLPVILLIGAVLLGRRALWLTTPAAILAVGIVAAVDLGSGLPYIPASLDDAIILAVLLLGCGGVIQLLINRLNEKIIQARESERKYIEENRELVELRSNLEGRVHERTLQLETANLQSERRARQFEAVAQVANAVSNIQDLETLLPRVASVISEKFGHYHTGIFLLDAAREYAVLRATNSPGGQRMLAREHKLRVGQTGIVGYVTASGKPRIALDVGADAVFFDNPDLPGTRSEIALPLHLAGQVIGAIDVQSEEADAFHPDDLTALLTLADQVAIAIQNTRALEEARKSLSEAQSAYAHTVQEAWRILKPESLGLGLQGSSQLVKRLETPLAGEIVQKALNAGQTERSRGPAGELAVPLRLRGRVIGVVNLVNKDGRAWTDDEVELVEAVTERLALAVESASLLRSAQYKADIERLAAEITTRVGSSSRFDLILQTAAEELSRALGGSDVLVQIEPAALKMGMSE